MYGRKFVAVVALLCLTVSIVLACGPDFPWQLLDDRPATFKATPANSFPYEAVRLVVRPSDSLKSVEGDDPDALAQAEAVGLSPEQAALVQQIRKQSTGDLAFQQGATLPLSVRLYTAAAIDFHRQDIADAKKRFEAILQLPQSDKLRATWAAYMLGRIYALSGDLEKAAAEFQLTRTLAKQGAPDPLGLAVASYGEEARLHLKRAESYFSSPNNLPRERTNDYSREMAAAADLYAVQAASGSLMAVNSLRMVAERLVGHQTANDDPITQRLLAAYALATAQTDVVMVPAVPTTFDHVKGADLFAALAYGAGNYPLAREWADKASGPLALWIKAKLALQRGDLGDAAAFYAEASRAFPPADNDQNLDLDDHNVKLLSGETGTLALARGEYVDALKYLYPVASIYWGDVAYIAERVLTVDELKQFVDARVPAPVLKPATSSAATDRTDVDTSVYDADPAAALRDLLARRLVRERRYQDALPYFHLPADAHFKDPDIRTHVTDYARALHEARHSWQRINRARGWFQAAVLARSYGMEMMGYETGPDYFINNGEFAGGYGQSNPGHCFVTDEELSRFAATTPKPDRRLRYRFIAVDEALHAADLLPPRSQAFAAVLCHATGWMMNTENIVDDGTEAHARVREIYYRYLREGPHVPWALNFGYYCPQPDFASAARLPRTLILKHMRHFVGRHRWQLGLSLSASLIALAAGVIWFWWREPVVPN